MESGNSPEARVVSSDKDARNHGKTFGPMIVPSEESVDRVVVRF
jgi:hypothetical protein